MALTSRIEINPAVMLGKPVVRNTRIPVELVLRKLGEGASIADLVDGYPRLTADDIRACLEDAAESIAHENTFSLTREWERFMRFLVDEGRDFAVGGRCVPLGTT